jgi:hypothetical protein
MVNLRRQLLGLGVVASSLLAINAAHAMSGPTAIQIDGGPLGPLELSGGLDGYGFYQTGTGGNSVLATDRSNGINVGSALVELQKNSGVLQFTIEVGSNGGTTTLGARPLQTSINIYSTGPLYAGYVTLAPKGSPVTISAGMMVSLEGYEGATDWSNPVQLTTAIFGVQNMNSRGVNLNYTKGPISATVMYGDGYNTGVFNFLQALVSYTINSSNTFNVYYGGNLGQTGLNAKTYGSALCSYGQTCGATVGTFGPQFDNSQLVGAYYSYTMGNLNLVPEVQYQVAKANAKLGIYKQTSNFGAALFETYTFGKSPYSLGGWIEYFDSHGSALNQAAGSDNWFLGPNSEAIGLAVAPTWQYKYLFARANAGFIYLLNNKGADGFTYGYGANGDGRAEFTGTLEAGVLF